jgi:hypothetical protein
MEAAEFGHLEIVHILVRLGADVNVRDGVVRACAWLFAVAIRRCHRRVRFRFAERKNTAHLRSPQGVCHGCTSARRKRSRYRAGIEGTQYCRCGWLVVCVHDSIHATVLQTGWTAAVFAVKWNHVETLEALIAGKANVLRRDRVSGAPTVM